MTDDKAMLEQLFAGGGEMGALMRSLDWSQTLLGPVSEWAQSLKTAASILLNSRYPMFIGWRRELVVLYNDAYRPILGGKHPQFLGKPLKEMWVEIWDVLGPLTDAVLNTGRSTWSEDLPLLMDRNGYLEEAYFTFSFSPVRDESGGIGGVFCAGTETTDRMIGERRLRTLRELGVNTAVAKTVEEACHLATTTLSANLYDIPFALLYLVEPSSQQARLVGTTTNMEAGTIASPQQVDLTQETDGWHLAAVHRTGCATIVTNLTERFGALPVGAWSDSPNSALVMPIAKAGQKQQLTGLLVVGISPQRELDDGYRGFFDLICNHVATAIANADAKEAERKRAEALAELDRAKTTFFSNVSHEFRTPLTLMLGPLGDVLANPTGLNPSDREQLEVVYRNSQRLLKLVNTLLDFSRIEAGRIEAVYEPTDLARLTTDLAGVFRSAIERAGLRLRVDCPSLPEPAYVDQKMWEKIVLNLLSNAFKFTFEGEVAVVLRSGDNDIILEVRDAGIGIPPEELPHIFERFHRVKEAKGRNYEGSGIGLSLVQELVRLHGGTIFVNSVVDRGTSFTVSIPKGCAHLPSDRIGTTRTLPSTAMRAAIYFEESLRWLPEEAGEQGSRGGSGSPLGMEGRGEQRSLISPLLKTARILLADDNADMRDYLKRLLSQYYEVESVADGVAALTAARQQLPDLVLTDVMMPGLDGFGLLRELRADPQTRELPIILLSARAGEEARVEGLKASADDYLIKPFSARELLASVEANLKLARLRQEAAQRERELRTAACAALCAAQAAEARLENVLSSINDQFLVLDHEWRYTYVNDRVVEVAGLPREELLGKYIWDVYPDTVESQLYTEVHRAVAEQTIVRFEYFYPPWQRWFEIRVYPTANGVSLLITEITERKQAESALRESNARLSFALDSAQLGDWDLDLLTRTARRSLKHDQIFGYDSLLPHWSYEIFLEHVYPEDRKFVGQKFQQTLVTHQDWDFECRILRSDQSIRWIWAQGSVYHDTHGTPIRILGIVTDITERKRTEEELLSSKHQLRLVTDNVPVFIAYYDTEGRYRFINRRYAECFGLKPEEAIGKHIPEVVGEEAYRSIREYIDTALSGQTISFEVEVPFETIGAHWMRIGYVPDFNERAEVRGLFAVVSDISDRKRAEIALQNSEAKFRAVFEQMYQFMGLLTPDGILVEVNQNPLRFANVERSAVIGLPLWEFPSLKATAELKKIAKTAVAQAASGQFLQGRVTIPDANNKPHTFDVSVKPIYATEIHPQVVFLIVDGSVRVVPIRSLGK